MDYKWLESSSVIIRLTLVNWLPAFHNLDCRSNVLLEWVKLPVPFVIRIAEWRCRCVGYGNNFLFHTRLEFTHKSTVVWTFAGKLNQKRIQYASLDLIRIVGTTLPAYIRIIRERHLAKIEIFIRTFRWPLREFWGGPTYSIQSYLSLYLGVSWVGPGLGHVKGWVIATWY